MSPHFANEEAGCEVRQYLGLWRGGSGWGLRPPLTRFAWAAVTDFAGRLLTLVPVALALLRSHFVLLSPQHPVRPSR